MTTKYAILGATGQTGQNILTILAKSPETHINVYVRSRSKLEHLFPTLTQQPNIHVFEGALKDIDLLRRCIADVSVVFSAIGINANPPNCSVAQDTARVLVEALQRVRDADAQATLPRVVFLSSLSVNNAFQHGGLFHWFLNKALCNSYGDLRKAETFLRQHEDWLRVVFVTPGALSTDPVQRGHRLSVSEKAGGFLGYVDLAAGMVEVAESGDAYDWKGVVVISKTPAKFDWAAPRNLVQGMWQTILQALF